MSGLPIPPMPKDKDFEEMAQLFIDAYEMIMKLNRDKWPEDMLNLQIRYFDIMKHRNEQVLGQEGNK